MSANYSAIRTETYLMKKESIQSMCGILIRIHPKFQIQSNAVIIRYNSTYLNRDFADISPI